jgi:hypothetical protein
VSVVCERATRVTCIVRSQSTLQRLLRGEILKQPSRVSTPSGGFFQRSWTQQRVLLQITDERIRNELEGGKHWSHIKDKSPVVILVKQLINISFIQNSN